MSRMLALACALVVFALAAGTVSTGALAQQAATPPYGPPIPLDDAKRVIWPRLKLASAKAPG